MPRAELVPKLPSTAQKQSHLAVFSTAQQTTHPDAETQTTCVRNAVQLGNQYPYFNLITCTDGSFSVTHLFYLFNSFDYFLLMAWIYPFLLFWNFRTLWWGLHVLGDMIMRGKWANSFPFTHQLSPYSSWWPILHRMPQGHNSTRVTIQQSQEPSHSGGRLFFQQPSSQVTSAGVFSSLWHVFLSLDPGDHVGYPSLIKGKLGARGQDESQGEF